MRLPFRILVLQDDPRTLSGLVHLLRDANYLVTGAATTDAARRLMALGSFDLLITGPRLDGPDGSRLLRQAQSIRPEMAVLVMGDGDASPRASTELLSAVSRALTTVRRRRRWERKRIAGAFRVIAHGLSASVIDVCYGGLRIEFSDVKSVPDRFDVEIEGIGLNLPVETVWSIKSPDGKGVLCGVALAADGTPAARTWRAIVERL